MRSCNQGRSEASVVVGVHDEGVCVECAWSVRGPGVVRNNRVLFYNLFSRKHIQHANKDQKLKAFQIFASLTVASIRTNDKPTRLHPGAIKLHPGAIKENLSKSSALGNLCASESSKIILWNLYHNLALEILPKDQWSDGFLCYSSKVKLCRQDFYCVDNVQQTGHWAEGCSTPCIHPFATPLHELFKFCLDS